MDERVVDARWLEPPEPLELALEAIDSLEPGQRLRLLIHRTPHLLYPILHEWGFGYQTISGDDGTFEILIWRGEPLKTDGAEPA